MGIHIRTPEGEVYEFEPQDIPKALQMGGQFASFGDYVNHHMSQLNEKTTERQKAVSPEGILNAGKRIPESIGHGLQSEYAGIMDHSYQEPEAATEPGGQAGQFIGQTIGKSIGPDIAGYTGGLIGGAIGGPLGIIPGAAIGAGATSYFTTPGETSDRAQAGILGTIFGALGGATQAPLTKGLASRPSKAAAKLVKERGVEGFKIDPELLVNAKKELPPSKNLDKLFQDIEKGGYEPAFGLQSDLKAESRGRAQSSSFTDRRTKNYVYDLGEDVLKDIQSQLRYKGHEDIADLLQKNKEHYAIWKKLDDKIYPYLKSLGAPVGKGAAGAAGLYVGKKLLDD